jgi:CRISPR-associated protein Cas2
MFVVVTYDIADDQRRQRVASELANFGERVQYSVFECHLTSLQVEELQQRLSALIVPAEDCVRYYPLCQKDTERIFIDGPGELTRDWDYFLI